MTDPLLDTLKKKRWVNKSAFCNRRTHPFYTPYKRYRRGKNRCNECGAKVGVVQCERKSYTDSAVDNIYRESPLLEYLKRKVEK